MASLLSGAARLWNRVAAGLAVVPPPQIPSASFGAADIEDGSASGTTCGNGTVADNYVVDGAGHFDTLPTTVFYDTSGATPSICGDLTFNDRTRAFKSTYSVYAADENPWKYWFRRGRDATSGASLDLTTAASDSAPAHQSVTDSVAMPLKNQYDLVVAILLLDALGNVAPDTGMFTMEEAGNTRIQITVQHWRHIDAPVLNSATVNGTDVTLAWTNHGLTRDIDSTNVYRSGTWIKAVGSNTSSFIDQNVSAGTYTYTVKHWSKPGEITRPPSIPNSASSNGIQVTVAGTCAYAENTSTWRLTDQYISAGCTPQGSNKRYRWLPDASGSWTSWTTDTLYDFLGHSTTGNRIVVLEDSNTTTGVKGRDTLAFSVASGTVVLTGATYITDKHTKTYTTTAGDHPGQWFERYSGSPTWSAATGGEQDTMTRIWPAGEYTETLRQSHVESGVLERGRLDIEVCNPCGPLPPPARSASAVASRDWGVFGAGPWVAWGSVGEEHALRLYDLWGQHDRQTVFGDPSWLAGAGGEYHDARTGWTLAWTPRTLGVADVRAFDMAVSGTRGLPYVFGMAVDPDLGASAADDQATYDASRGLVLVADGQGAAGFMLRSAGVNVLSGVREYGVGRFAPATEAAAWQATRGSGVQLVGTPRDVQLLLSAAPAREPSSWLFVVIRGDTPTAVRASADAVIAATR